MATNIESQEDARAKEEVAPPKHRAGFDCELVTPHSGGDTQVECPVCLLVIREPFQVTCCGYNFCKSCIQQVKTDNKPCPSCKKENFTPYFDKRLERFLYALKVRCTHQRDGCEWTGELGQLDEHLNSNPEPKTQLVGCHFEKISCLHCPLMIQRHYMQNHQTTDCTSRPFECEHCQRHSSSFDDVTSNHWPVCGSFPVQCPNDCGSTLQRQNSEHHVSEECPLTITGCDFEGCAVKIPRKDVSEHLRENLLPHISLLAASHAKQNATIVELVAENEMLKSKNENLEHNYRSEITVFKNKLKKLETMVTGHQQEQAVGASHNSPPHEATQDKPSSPSHTLIPQAPPVLVMANVRKHKADGDHWYSSPVYTHYQGYKLCLKVEIVPWGETVNEVQVSIHLMKGEFDDCLEWPFRGKISIQLVDQVKGQGHRKFDVTYANEDDVGSRVTLDEVARYGKEAFTHLISDNQDGSKYLRNDTLIFQIYNVQLE